MIELLPNAGAAVAQQWRSSGAAVAQQWRSSGAAVAPRALRALRDLHARTVREQTVTRRHRNLPVVLRTASP
jgi:hypothetical protein